MRIIFMGSPEFAVPTLNALVAAGHEIAAVYTQPPRPAGRGKGERATAVELRARALGIEVRSPRTLRDAEKQAAFAALKADVAVVAAYGLILPQAILDAPKLGCLNVHGSLLPRWRGAAPVQRAIMAGDEVTGVTIMQMEAGLDTGPMLLWEKLAIENKSAGEITDKLAEIGAFMMCRYLDDMERYPPIPQPDEGATYAPKIDKSEARLDFSQPAQIVDRQVRAFNVMPGAYFEFMGERIKVLEAEVVPGSGPPGMVADNELKIACGERAIRPIYVQRAGRSRMHSSELLRGFPIPKGAQLNPLSGATE